MSQSQVGRLLALSVRVSDYAEHVFRTQEDTPERAEVLRRLCQLQAQLSLRLERLLSHPSAAHADVSPSSRDSEFGRAFRHAPWRRQFPEPALRNDAIVEEVQRVMTLLGPNEGFPDDPPKPPKTREE
jgi:hypothetical protein